MKLTPPRISFATVLLGALLVVGCEPAPVLEQVAADPVDLVFTDVSDAPAEAALGALWIRRLEWEQSMRDQELLVSSCLVGLQVYGSQDVALYQVPVADCDEWVYAECDQESGEELPISVSGATAIVHVRTTGAEVRFSPGLESLQGAEHACVSFDEGVTWQAFCAELRALNEAGIQEFAMGFEPGEQRYEFH